MTATGDIIGVIPARYGSTRLPGKPLVDLGGKTMIQRVYEAAVSCTVLSRVLVATDHSGIASVVSSFGGTAVMTPSDLPSGTDRIAYATRHMKNIGIVVNIQGDEPFMNPDMINQMLEPLLRDAGIPVGTLAKPITTDEDLHNPNVVKVVVNENGLALYFSRAPVPYVRDIHTSAARPDVHIHLKHIGLYAYRFDALQLFTTWKESPIERAEKLEQLRFLDHGYPISVARTAHDSNPVDTPADVERTRALLRISSERGM